MKSLHIPSFIGGIASGVIILALVGSVWRWGRPYNSDFAGGRRMMNTQQMAERFGMTEQELQKELDSGKTMPQIAQEHGVNFQSGSTMRGQRGVAGSGGVRSSASSSSSTL